MASSINKVIIGGNLTKNPELRYTPNGTAVCGFSIATNRTWKDKQGAKQEEVEFHNCTAWAGTAEFIAKYLVKGQKVTVVGRIKTDKWTDDAGNPKQITKIVVEEIMPASLANREPKLDVGEAQAAMTAPMSEDVDPDDIPF
jgi:single-strand DNA-binding protein